MLKEIASYTKNEMRSYLAIWTAFVPDGSIIGERGGLAAASHTPSFLRRTTVPNVRMKDSVSAAPSRARESR